MTEELKEKIIRNSLLLYVMIDELPYGNYDIESFEHGVQWLINHIKEIFDSTDLSIYEMMVIKKQENERHADFYMNYRFQKIIKKEYAKHFRSGLTQKLRKQVLERDNYKCQYCGADLRESIDNPFPPTVDHVKPMRTGGKNEVKNLVACCWKCNTGKKDYDEFRYEDEDMEAE